MKHDPTDLDNPRIKSLTDRWSREDLLDLVLFIERAVNHHGHKLTTKETLGIVQHHPMITAITECFDDGAVPLKAGLALGRITDAERQVIAKPDFRNKDRVHDWRNYVPETLVSVWSSLSEETRTALYIASREQAYAEDWD